MQGVRALQIIATCVLCAACAAPRHFTEDGWGVQRRFEQPTPALLSISEINADSTPAAGALSATRVRVREDGRHRVVLSAEESIAPRWTAGAALLDADLDRALDWLERLGAHEPRGFELRLTLVPMVGKRRQLRQHPAHDTLVIDLLVPVPAQPRSRSAVLEQALATGLHEASHAVRGPGGGDRDVDEYRAALAAACFRIDGLQRRDHMDLSGSVDGEQREFTRAHSRQAALAVKRDLAAALGQARLEGSNTADIERLRQFCNERLAR